VSIHTDSQSSNAHSIISCLCGEPGEPIQAKVEICYVENFHRYDLFGFTIYRARATSHHSFSAGFYAPILGG